MTRCQALTDVLSIAPGSIKDGKRQIWELGQVHMLDGGPDGDAETTADNSLFERPGLFVP